MTAMTTNDRLLELKDDAVKTLGKNLEELGVLMKANPVASIAAGLGLGYLLARLIHR